MTTDEILNNVGFDEESIYEYLEKVKALAVDAPEPEHAHWLVLGDEESIGYYCGDCARKIIAWVNDGGGQPEGIQKCDLRLFASMSREENYYQGSYGSLEAEGCEHCELCGVHLSVTLLTHGVESELDHFECHGIESADDWRHFLDVCDGIDFVESAWFPGNWMKESEIKEMRALYQRTLCLLKKHFPDIEKVPA